MHKGGESEIGEGSSVFLPESSQIKSSAIYFKTQLINKIQLKQIHFALCNVTKYQIYNVK